MNSGYEAIISLCWSKDGQVLYYIGFDFPINGSYMKRYYVGLLNIDTNLRKGFITD